MQDVRTQLAEEMGPVAWEVLLPHAKRDALVVVNGDLNLLDVGVAIAQDDTISVQNWISTAQLQKPSPEQLSSWNDNPAKQFRTLIVQPFVLIQEPNFPLS